MAENFENVFRNVARRHLGDVVQEAVLVQSPTIPLKGQRGHLKALLGAKCRPLRGEAIFGICQTSVFLFGVKRKGGTWVPTGDVDHRWNVGELAAHQCGEYLGVCISGPGLEGCLHVEPKWPDVAVPRIILAISPQNPDL